MSRTADNFPAIYFIILKAGLRFVTSLRSDKTGTSFSLAAFLINNTHIQVKNGEGKHDINNAEYTNCQI
ncbi:MAG: hypothetical protein A2131_00650 [Candidatus Sungbacteria bacterium GWC2_49_10]|uniref:Uncharacterized protein n=1 Tax=Candidatus Sungbacteria bacterium GWC2_49_10 TaxID=1802263 RepID=A0A1G2K5G2_9BACT|nr:MAG: hypothetical protein A2131_00650 [Candidatus Sungbacteria bacterium GWC2_49_10]